MKYFKPMVPILVDEIPKDPNWIYEAKYDGFRCLMYILEDRVELISRNLKNISGSFPEIISEITKKKAALSKFLPLVLDGEIVILESQYRASFEKIQLRGRTTTKSKISALVKDFPANFITFDILLVRGASIMKAALLERKAYLSDVFKSMKDQEINNQGYSALTLIKFFENSEEIWTNIATENGEGIVAKRINSAWSEGTRTLNWLKIKNWKKANFFIISLEKQNGYFHVALLKDGEILHAGLFSHGIKKEERQALNQIIKTNAVREDSQFIYIDPSICVELLFIDWYKNEIRQPRFSKFRLDINWEACTWQEARKCLMK